MLWTLFAVSATCQQTNISSEWLQLIFSPFPLLLCEVVLTCDHCSLSVCAENIYTTAALWFWIRAYERLSVMFVCYLSEGQGNIDISAFKRLSTTSQWSVSSGIFFFLFVFSKKKKIFLCVFIFQAVQVARQILLHQQPQSQSHQLQPQQNTGRKSPTATEKQQSLQVL